MMSFKKPNFNTNVLQKDLDPQTSRSSRESVKRFLDEMAISNRSPAVSNLTSDSIYTDVFSDDIDHWIRGNSSLDDIGVQGLRRVNVGHQGTLTSSPNLNASGMWYIPALILPLLGINNGTNWRCTPRFCLINILRLLVILKMDFSAFMNAAELFVGQIASVLSGARAQLRSVANDHLGREIFATFMDIVLILYALGFLVLSMCQAAVTQRHYA